MVNLLKKIMHIGNVTEKFDAAPVPERFRGEIIKEDCDQCLKCTDICPVDAIKLQNSDIIIDNRSCIFCGRCVEFCQQQKLRHTNKYKLARVTADAEMIGQELKQKVWSVLGRSLSIRHLDAGSCNACDFEMAALNNPIYDLQQYGIDFVASPRHADMLMVTGVVTRNLSQALLMTYEAVPEPKLVMAVGACAASGKTFGASYAIRGGVNDFIPVDIYVPGCPPRPAALIYGLLLVLNRLKPDQ